MIKRLEGALAEHRQLSERLRSEILILRDAQAPATGAASDLKFKRLKHKLSKRFDRDTHPPEDAERERRELVFQEFWPIFEEIERS